MAGCSAFASTTLYSKCFSTFMYDSGGFFVILLISTLISDKLKAQRTIREGRHEH